MTDQEFDILDELYFVTDFETIRQAVGLTEAELKEHLGAMLSKGWVKCFIAGTYEVVSDTGIGENLNFDHKYATYQYLATKAGLLAHNTI